MTIETKNEIEARLDEIDKISKLIPSNFSILSAQLSDRKEELMGQLKLAGEDLFQSVLHSHKILCEIKQMGEKSAYGQHPVLYYAAAVAAESGECLNKIIKALRNGDDPEATKAAVVSELPDVFIYGVVLAFVLDLNLTKLVAEKAQVVIQRALDGYYGGPLNMKNDGVIKVTPSFQESALQERIDSIAEDMDPMG